MSERDRKKGGGGGRREMMGVIAACHTHLKLSLPGRQRRRWIEA